MTPRTLIAAALFFLPVAALADPPATRATATATTVSAVSGPRTHRLILPPYAEEWTGGTGYRTLFPLYFESWTPQSRSRLIGPYYHSSGPGGAGADVLFPLFWSLRSARGSSTTILGPLMYHSAPRAWDFALAPIVFAGGSARSDYLVIPPLVWHFGGARRRLDILGPYYSSRTPTGTDWGIAPLYFAGTSEQSHYNVLFPLVWHFGNDQENTSTTLAGPFLHRDGPGWWSLSLLPLFYYAHGRGADRFTLLPLVHWARREARPGAPSMSRLITPLFGYSREGRSSTLITPLYQRIRGDTWLDSVAPLLWFWGDERTGESNTLLFPLVYSGRGRNHSDFGLFPLVYTHHAYNVARTIATPLFVHTRALDESRSTTWAFPTFEYSESPTGWRFNLYPILYFGREGAVTHNVLFPLWINFQRPRGHATVAALLYWDFEDRDSRSHDVVAFPFYWQFGTPEDRTVFLLPNVVYRSGRTSRGPFWSFQFFPLFNAGSDYPGHLLWQVLYGLVGYERAGAHKRMYLGYLDFGI